MELGVMSGHTPGPWSQSHRKQSNGHSYITQVYDAKGQTIADLAWYPAPQPDGRVTTLREANARLIAAAPELLAALIALRDAVKDVLLPALNAKPPVEMWLPEQMQYGDAVVLTDAAIAKAEGR